MRAVSLEVLDDYGPGGRLTDGSKRRVRLKASSGVRLVHAAKTAIETVRIGNKEETEEDKAAVNK